MYSVTLKTPVEPLFVGAYARVPVIINAESGLSMDDLDFIVSSGPEGGDVSLSRDDSFDDSKPDIMLLAGYQPGDYQLQVVERSTGRVLGMADFIVTTLWKNEKEGPSIWTTGDYKISGVAGAVWGGGDPQEPENYNVTPAIGTKKVAVLLIDTKSQRFNQSDIQNITTLWQDIAYSGRSINGKTVSAAHYYSEVSYGKLKLKGDVFGPVSLSGDWDEYFEYSGELDLYKSKGNFWHACVAAGDLLINYKNYDYLVCAVQSIDATQTNPSKRVWPWANSILAKTTEGDIPLEMVAMYADGDPFDMCASLAHELGHNIGLGDIYPWSGHPQQIQDRTPGHWDIMAYQNNLPHPVLVHRMRLGWVPKETIKLYNPKEVGGIIDDEIVTLHPVELANPPIGRYSGIEVRIAPGWNYYFEYRVTQGNQIGDQQLPTNNRVLGTDVMMGDDIETVSRRRPVLLLMKDADGDGPVLDAGQDFKTQDISEEIPAEFSAYVINNGGTKADVRIRYGVSSQPDPSIRPWNPPVYKSPDIEIRNERSKYDPKWANTPWKNRLNTVVAKVTNLGKLNAPGVVVKFFVHDYTTNNPPKQPFDIGEDKKDVPAGQTVEFETVWRPKEEGHYCIQARIQHYQTPGPNSVIEATEYNNKAQSNYDRFISETASPPTRKVTSVEVQNPLNVPVCANIHIARSTNPLFRTYIGQRWLELQPGETKKVELMFEYIHEKDPVWIDELEKYIGRPNDVSIYSVIHTHVPGERSTRMVLGGVNAQIERGKATRIKDFEFDPPKVVSGKVITVDKEEYVPGGKIILCLGIDGKEEYRIADVSYNGRFTVDASGYWDTIQAYYIPLKGYGESESNIISKPEI